MSNNIQRLMPLFERIINFIKPTTVNADTRDNCKCGGGGGGVKDGHYDNFKYLCKKQGVLQRVEEYYYIPSEFLHDKDIWLKFLKIRPWRIKDIDANMFKDRAFAKTILMQYPKALKYANDETKDDKQLVYIALRTDGKNLKYASKRLRKKYDACAIANADIKYDSMLSSPPQHEDAPIKYCLNDEFKSDEEIFMLRPSLIKYASASLLSNKDFAIKYLSNYGGGMLGYFADEIRSDKEVVKRAETRYNENDVYKFAHVNLWPT